MAEQEEQDQAEAGEQDEASSSASNDENEEGEAEAAPIKPAPKAKKRRVEAKAADADEEAEERAEEANEEAAGDADEEAAAGGPDAAAARVAEALGLDEPEGGALAAAADEPAEEAVQNRAARRREEAVERRRKKKGGEAKALGAARAKTDEDEALPKDKNARAKELLRRRREEAAGRRPVDLLPGEMVDDALSRMASSASRWIRGNFGLLQWLVVGGIVVAGGFMGYTYLTEKSAMAASSALSAAVADERGKVLAEDKRSDEEKEVDASKIFKTAEERQEAALRDYNQVIDKYAGTGPAILAKLGQAGVYLDKKDFPHALDAYAAVLATPLATADPDVKGRAIEGLGFAKEGKADLDGALASFKELEGIEVKPYKELSLYHQARILLMKGGDKDKEEAKKLLKTAREKLQAPSADGHSFQFLEAVVDDTLRKIDPSAVPARKEIGGAKGNQMTPEELQALMRRAQEAAEKKAGKGHGQ